MQNSASTAPEWRISSDQVPYEEAVAVMRQQVEAIRTCEAREQVWLLDHPALYTAGTSAKPQDLASNNTLPVFAAGRGGQWTYHGPGQRVAYVMLDLEREHGRVRARDLHAYVDGLEYWLISALRCFGVAGERRAGRVGVWIVDARTGTEAKIASIGVRITRWVSWHGISLNVSPDLSHFDGIVPCGIREHGVTSLQALGVRAGMAEVDMALQKTWPSVFENSPA